MINALLIGGPDDGKRMMVASNTCILDVQEMPYFSVVAEMEKDPQLVPLLKETRYYRVDVVFMYGVAIFTPDPQATSAMLMAQLIDGYRVGKAENAE